MLKFKQGLLGIGLAFGVVCGGSVGGGIVPTAFAAQDAVVSVDEAAIRERPATDSKVIESVPRGVKFKISNKQKDGWYKARAKTGQVGWVSQDDVTLTEFADEFKAGQLVLKPPGSHERREYERDPFIFLNAGGTALTIYMANFSQSVGLGPGHVFIGSGWFADLSIIVWDNFRLGIRGMGFSNTTSVQYLGNNYQITNEGHPLLFGIERPLASNDTFELDVGAYVGYSLNNRVTIVTTNLGAANSATVVAGQLAYLLNFNGIWKFSRWVNALAGLGFYYSTLLQTQIPAFNGQVPAGNPALALSNVDAQHVGPIVSLGLQFAY